MEGLRRYLVLEELSFQGVWGCIFRMCFDTRTVIRNRGQVVDESGEMFRSKS